MRHYHAATARIALGLIFTTILLITGCHRVAVDQSPVLATVNGEHITERDYQDYLRARDQQEPALPRSPASRHVILNELINRVVLAQAATQAGLNRTPAVHVALKEDRENILARAMLKRFLTTDKIPLSRLHALYQQEVLSAPHVEYKARHILVATYAQAEAILTALHHGARFAVLARRDSLDIASGQQGGQLGWFSAGSMLPSFYNAVSHMHVGEISPTPIKTRFGWHIIQLQAERAYTPPPFTAVRQDLYRAVEQRHVDNMMAALRKKAHIVIMKTAPDPPPG
ncbi:MAG: peptidylprolyl isomerase [Acidiferrobacter sp.]